MANTSISNLAAGAAVSATDVLPNVQTAGVGPVKTTAAELKTFMSASPTFVTPALGTPTSGNFSTGTFTWPTFNQNTTGTAAGLSSTLAIASGGTNATSFTTGYPVYFNGTAFAQGTTSTKEFFWDNANGRLGIGTASPTVRFHLIGGRSTFAANSESFAMYVQYNSGTTGYYFGGSSDSGLAFSTGGGSEAMRIGAGRNVLIGATAEPTSSYFNLVLGTGGAPSADPAAGLCALWFDGTNLKARVGATTKTITWS